VSLLLFGLLIVSEKAVEVRCTEIAPKIDGKIEDIWREADSACAFVQYRPNEGDTATEPTIVYVLADDNNLYFAFRCLTPSRKPVASFSGAEDQIFLYLDTFRNKTTAYFFNVCASGIKEDGLILEDGKIWDLSWDGIWYYGVKCYDNSFEVEIKIPFKSIRYKKELNEWGVNFELWSVKDYEISYWSPVTKKDKLQISKFGMLKGINLKSKSYYIELYPEGFFRYDKIGPEKQYKLSASFNFKLDLTSQSTLNATVNPDFAQIESDPYRLNLTRYPIRVRERRPFFVEGSDVFRMSSLGEDFFTPLEIFYSRRIGKPLSDEGSVPILGGLKFINKEKRWNFGVLGALTDTTDEGPRQGFMVMRARHSVLKNSEVGILYSSAAIDKDNYNYAVGLDGTFRHGSSQFIVQSALSDRNGKRGWAFSSGGLYNAKTYEIMGSAFAVDDSFDIWDVGYVPWAGLMYAYSCAGPRWYYKTGAIRKLFIGVGANATKEPGSDEWSKIANIPFELRFRNRWGCDVNIELGQKHEVDTAYFYRSVDISAWSDYRRMYSTNFGCYYAYCYNYRQDWLADQLSSWIWFAYFPISPLSLSTSIDVVFEWDPNGELVAITPYATPRIEYKFNATTEVAVYSQFVFETDADNISDTEIWSNRIGFLFSWNFRPKSWLYIAFNDYRERNESGELSLQDRIGAIKVKYLLYF